MNDLVFTSILGYPAPNVSVVVESGGGHVGKNQASPTGCYGSIYRNESDFSSNPIEYPINDFKKVDPVQVLYEGPLDIVSMYRVEEKESVIYADLLESSLKSFDMNIWSAIIVSFVVFSLLLFIRQYIYSGKNKMGTQGCSPILETFTHMIGQESIDFTDRSGRMISFDMTIGFFFIMSFYLNLMSTDLVVVTKPHVINNYRDVMKREDMKVIFTSVTYDVLEFESAKEGTTQKEFWNIFKKKHMTYDLKDNMKEAVEIAIDFTDQKNVGIIN